MSSYDRIFKENINAIFEKLISKLLNITVVASEPVATDKLQTTIEREPDFLKIINTSEGKRFILQLEFQTVNDPEMEYRMAEYKAIIQRKFRLPVRQLVLFLGTDKVTMRTNLPKEEQITGYELHILKDQQPEALLASDIAEEVMLAVLAKFDVSQSEFILCSIIEKLQRLAPTEAELRRYLQQLFTLSRMRNLELRTEQIVTTMSFTYDITKDGLYLKGKHQEAIEKDTAFVQQLLLDGTFGVEKIAALTQTSVVFVKQVQKEMKESK